MKTKQLFLLLLMSIMSVSVFAEDAVIDGIKYSLNNETLQAKVIPNYDNATTNYLLQENKYSGNIIIPEAVDYNGKTYSVTSIGNNAFFNCTGLTSVTIPNSVIIIRNNAFSGCSALTSITVEKGNLAYNSRENCNAVIDSETNELILGCKNTVIPNSVTTIGYYAFGGCESLTTVTIPNSVTSIGQGAFSSCLGLESIIVEEGNTVYDSRDNCNAIIETETNTLIAGCKNTVIPNSITSIGESAFSGCKGLTSITIPNSITSIGDWAFSECSGLTSVISLIEEPFEINENTFEYSDWVEHYHYEFTTATLYVPTGTKEKYEGMPAWNMFKNIVEGIENAVKSVETDAKAEETERYNVSGQRISSPQKGLNVVKMSDGTTRKVMCK